MVQIPFTSLKLDEESGFGDESSISMTECTTRRLVLCWNRNEGNSPVVQLFRPNPNLSGCYPVCVFALDIRYHWMQLHHL